MAKNEDFRGKSADELQTQVAEMKKELFNLRFQLATGELANNARFREVRKNIARALTELGSIKRKSKKAA
ncbi:MAG: 50S ribosomal protein L29 [Rickettsiales bacterium]